MNCNPDCETVRNYKAVFSMITSLDAQFCGVVYSIRTHPVAIYCVQVN